MWERRYQFPSPLRDEHGERLYPHLQVEKLRLVKRLMDAGHRPGRLISCTLDELNALTLTCLARVDSAAPDCGAALRLVRGYQVADLRQHLTQTLMKQGLQRFVLDTVAPLNQLVGEAWMRGELAVYEEHLYTEQMQGILRTAICNMQQACKPPRVLLTSFPGEEHRLGLLMVEALLTVEGVTCIGLGNEIPLPEIVQAAFAHRADIVGLSFSGAFQTNAAVAGLKELRSNLSHGVAIWVGGGGMDRVRRPIPGVTVMRSLEDLLRGLCEWREAHASP